MRTTIDKVIAILFCIIVWPIHGLLFGVLKLAFAIVEITWSMIKEYGDHLYIGWRLLNPKKDAG